MDPEQQRIQEDLRGQLKGEVRCDELFTQLYASDASIYELRPLGVVRPRTLDDVVATVRYAAENHLPIHARGAGTGLAGESLGRGIVLDFSRYFRRIVADEGDRVRVQPGVVLSALNRHLATSGRLFGPDPAMRSVTTMGSVVAIDAGGSHWPRYGSARRHVTELQIVLATGEVLRVGRHAVDETLAQGNGHDASLPESTNRLPELVRSVAGLIHRHAATIAKHQPQSLVNRSGYQLHGVLSNNQLDLAKLLVGSEGTLALITEATLTIDRLPIDRGCVLLLFDSLDKAANAALEIARLQASRLRFNGPPPPKPRPRNRHPLRAVDSRRSRGGLLVEHHAASREELQSKLDGCDWTSPTQIGPRCGRPHQPTTKPTFNCIGGWASDSCPRCIACRVRRDPCRGSRTSRCRSRRCPCFLRHCRTRSSGCR